MTRMHGGLVQGQGPMEEGKPIVRWRRGPQPFKIIIQNSSNTYWTHITGSPEEKTGYILLRQKSEGDQLNQVVIEVPAAERGEVVEDEAVYFYHRHNAIVTMRYLVQPSSGDTVPDVALPQEELPDGLLSSIDPTAATRASTT